MPIPTVAMLYPGYSAEDEFPSLERVIGGVSLPVLHTWEGPTAHGVEALRALGAEQPLVAAGTLARTLDPDAVMWACTSGSFVYGARGVHEQAEWLARAAGVPASSTSIAFPEAMRHLGVRRPSVVATYPAAVTQHFTDLLADAGMAAVAVVSNDVPSGEDAGRLDEQQVLDLLTGVLHPDDADVVLVPDTALHTVGLLTRFEAKLGRPVLTANQVTAWYGLRLAGWSGSARGLGALFD